MKKISSNMVICFFLSLFIFSSVLFGATELQRDKLEPLLFCPVLRVSSEEELRVLDNPLEVSPHVLQELEQLLATPLSTRAVERIQGIVEPWLQGLEPRLGSPLIGIRPVSPQGSIVSISTQIPRGVNKSPSDHGSIATGITSFPLHGTMTQAFVQMPLNLFPSDHNQEKISCRDCFFDALGDCCLWHFKNAGVVCLYLIVGSVLIYVLVHL